MISQSPRSTCFALIGLSGEQKALVGGKQLVLVDRAPSKRPLHLLPTHPPFPDAGQINEPFRKHALMLWFLLSVDRISTKCED